MTHTVAIVIAVIAVIAVAGAYVTFKALSRRKEADKPPVSLVCLLGMPRRITEADLRRCVSEAFNVTLDAEDPDATQFVVELPTPPLEGAAKGKAESFMVKVDQGIFMVNCFAVPYVERPDAFAAGIHDKRLRAAISSHRAWISVDAMTDDTGEESKAETYRAIGKMIAALLGSVGQDCLAIYSPELQRCNEYDQVLVDKLRSDAPLALFDEPTFAPIVNVKGSDPRMVQAVAEARRRWPEFVAAFQSDPTEDKPFIVKAEFKDGDQAEFMWISVNAIETDTIHGVLDNAPFELTNVKQGQQVAVPLSALNDWLYSKEGEAVGGFTLEVINEVQNE